jgi:signal transduction histidine kinase
MTPACADPEQRRPGSVYGAFAFASVILTAYGSYLYTTRFFHSEMMVPVTFVLGGAYAILGILWGDSVGHRSGWQNLGYYAVQCALVTAVVFLSPARGFFGMIVLPLVSQSIFDLRPRHTALVIVYLFLVCIGVWGIDFGWDTAIEASFSYAAGFAFTVVFTIITKQAVLGRRREEALRRELEAANARLRAQAEQAEELATTRERNRLAREIHDGVGHYLTVVKTQLDAAAALLPAQPDRAREGVVKAARLTAEALDDVRRSVGALRTDAARPPLPDALKELAAHGEPAPTLAIEGQPRPLAAGVEHALYRAAQEGLTNIRKHARATNALVRLDFRLPQRVVLELADNGVGASAGHGAPGFGLRGLRERIELLGGTVNSGNRLEGGFALRVEVPA